MTTIELGLIASAAGVGLGHALIGLDHSLPFIALAKTHRWSWKKALGITLACGMVHVGGGWLLGMAMGLMGASTALWAKTISMQAHWAGWGLILFGALYLVWGLRAAFRRDETKTPGTAGAWILFLLFVFGPCEPLLPFMATAHGMGRPALVPLMTLAFGTATLATMGVCVLGGLGVLSRIKSPVRRWSPALSGVALLTAGLAVKFAGL